MKKAIALLLALALVGGAVFAEGLEISGYVNAGMKMTSNSTATTFKLYSDDWGGDTTFAYMDVSYTGDMSGASVTFIGDSNGTVGVDTAYGWVSPMAGLKLIGGNWYGGAFDGVDDDSNDYFSSEGISATYSISGFTAGVGQVLTTVNVEKPDYVFGAAYAIDGMLKLRASVRTAETDLNKMAISASYTGVPNLTLSAGYLAEDMIEATVFGLNNWVDATAKYTMDKINAQVVMYYFLAKEYFQVAPRVGYMVNDKMTVYGQVKYESEGEVAGGLNPTTIVPRLNVGYKIDAMSKMYAQFEYDTDLETTTFFLNYVWSF
jgi:hypothetical protein